MDLNNLRHPSNILKMVEVVLLIIIMALYFSQLPIADLNFMTSIFIGCFLNALVLLTVKLLGYNQIQNTPLELIIYVFYVVSLFVSGILLFLYKSGAWVAAGIFSLLTMLVYCADWYYAFIGLYGYPPSLQSLNQQTGSSQSDANEGQGPHDVLPSQTGYQTGYQQQSPDGVDAALPSHGIMFHTNPVYPPMMNYPPEDYPTKSPSVPRP